MSQVATEHPTTADIGWLAGIVEGEGYMRYAGYTCQLEVVQKDDWLVWKLQNLFGGGVTTIQNKKTNKHYWKWIVTGPRARGIVMTIYKFLSPRRKLQALLAIERIKL